MERILAVFDSDVLYASRLVEYINNSGLQDFETLLFTKQESLVDFLKYQPVEILLYGDDILPEDLPKSNVKYIFFLGKDSKSSEDKYEKIYKYQSAGKIRSDIISYYTRHEDDSRRTTYDSVQFISVFSPVSGAEKLAFAWLLAKEASKDKKVLFISLDMFPTTYIIGDEDRGHAMSEYLYYLKEGSSNHVSKLKSYLNYSEKLSYLSGLSHGFDLLSLSREEAGRIIDDMKDHKDYEMVIFYLGIYTEASMEILSRSNQVCLAINNLPYEELVIKEWERQMELTGLKINELKNHNIKLPILDRTDGSNPLAQIICSSIRPMAAELARQL